MVTWGAGALIVLVLTVGGADSEEDPQTEAALLSGEHCAKFRHQRRGQCKVKGGPKGPFCLKRVSKQRKARDPLSSSIRLFQKLESNETQYLLLLGAKPGLSQTPGESSFVRGYL